MNPWTRERPTKPGMRRTGSFWLLRFDGETVALFDDLGRGSPLPADTGKPNGPEWLGPLDGTDDATPMG